MRITAHRRILAPAAAAVAGLLALSGCSSSSSPAEADAGGGEGFEFGAPQAEVDALVADLEPITLTYQTPSTSPDSTAADSAYWFKEAIEERSNGKITVDIVWGQAIASYPEVDDALRDGRVDIAFTAPIYDPAAYPVFDSLSRVTQLSAPSPMVGELVSTAMISELAWSTPELLEEYAEKDLTPLSPVVTGGDYYMGCNAQSAGTTAQDWHGRQVRIGGTVHERIVSHMGGTPVSMEYGETFEALQRNTINCTFGQLGVAVLGVFEAAPNLSYLTGEQSFAGRVGSAHVAGSDYASMPLVYQQIVFDADARFASGWMNNTMDNKVLALSDSAKANGVVEPIDPEVQKAIYEIQDEMLAEVEDSGVVESGLGDRARELAAKWEERVADMGYADGGEFADMGDWYSSEDMSFDEYADAVFAEASLPHRPA